MGRLEGKVAVITGAASGIGRAAAVSFAAEGAFVVGGDLNRAGGEETAALCRAQGPGGDFVKTDVADEGEVAALIALATTRFGGLDILFNNAGVSGAIGPIEEISAELWDRTQNIVLRSALFGIKHAVAPLRARGGGSIIQTSSIAGMVGFAGLHAYCASKAALLNLTRSAAVELGPDRIRVNCICPGDIATPMRSGGLSPAELEHELATHQPIPRAGQAEDVARAALFLASDEAEWITGVSLPVDGGATIGLWTYGQNRDISHVRKTGFLDASFLRAAPAPDAARAATDAATDS